MRTAAILGLLLLLVGCQSPPSMQTSPDALATQVGGPKSGDASSKATDTTVPFSPAFSYMGDAESSAVAAAYSPQKQNTSTGSLVTGFVLGITAEQSAAIQDAIERRLKNDVALQSMANELAALEAVEMGERDEAWYARVDALRPMYSAAAQAIVDSMERGGQTGNLDLASLQTLVVIGFIRGSNAGHDELAPTPEESDGLKYILSNIVDSAKGQEGYDPGGDR